MQPVSDRSIIQLERVKMLQVKCPSCESDKQVPCQTASGKFIKSSTEWHASRRVAADVKPGSAGRIKK